MGEDGGERERDGRRHGGRERERDKDWREIAGICKRLGE